MTSAKKKKSKSIGLLFKLFSSCRVQILCIAFSGNGKNILNSLDMKKENNCN
jgi:hypothetical protein